MSNVIENFVRSSTQNLLNSINALMASEEWDKQERHTAEGVPLTEFTKAHHPYANYSTGENPNVPKEHWNKLISTRIFEYEVPVISDEDKQVFIEMKKKSEDILGITAPIDFSNVEKESLAEQLEKEKTTISYGVEQCEGTGTKVLTRYLHDYQGNIIETEHLHAKDEDTLEEIDGLVARAYQIGFDKAQLQCDKEYNIGIETLQGDKICICLGVNDEGNIAHLLNGQWIEGLPIGFSVLIADKGEVVFDEKDNLIIPEGYQE